MKKSNHKRSGWAVILALTIVVALLTNGAMNVSAYFTGNNSIEEEVEGDADYIVKEGGKFAAGHLYPIKLRKVDSNDSSKGLRGAKFRLTDNAITGDVGKVVTSDSSGVVEFEKLSGGDYTIVEEEAPSGYKILTKPITVNIGQGGYITAVVNGKKQTGNSLVVKVPNEIKYKNPVGKLNTTVGIGNNKAGSRDALRLKVDDINDITTVTDTITYEGLVGGREYVVTGILNKKDGFFAREITTKTERKFASSSGKGTWTMEFNDVAGKLEYGKEYVVYEEAVSVDDLIDSDSDGIPDKKQKVEHKNIGAVSQTFLIKKKGKLKTIVSINGNEASPTEALTLKTDNIGNITKVTDKIHYDGLFEDEKYTIKGTLNKVVGSVITTISTTTKEVRTSSSGSGEWTVEFDDVAGKLEYDTKYVVFEEVTSKNKFELDSSGSIYNYHKLEHKNRDDLSQTFFIKEKKNFVKIIKKDKKTHEILGGAKFEIYKKGTGGNDLGAKVVDETEIPATGKMIKLPVGEYIAVETAAPAGYILPSPESARRSAFKIEAAHTEDDPYLLEVENTKKYNNPDGKLETTVNINGRTGSGGNALILEEEDIKAVATVSDTIRYEGLVGGKSYTVKGTLNKIVNNQVESTIDTVEKILIAEASGNGMWTMDFNVAGKLEYDARYVVFEEAVSLEDLKDTNDDGEPDEKQRVEHKKVDAVTQTILTKKPNGFVRIVKKGKVADAATSDDIGGAIFDIYEDDNNILGRLVKENLQIPVGGVVIELPVGKYIAVEKVAPTGYILPKNEADRRSSFTIGKINSSSNPIEIVVTNIKRYINPNGKIGTTVSVSGSAASATKVLILEEDDINKVKIVKDTIKYSGLVGDKKYTVTGSLNKIVNGTVAAVIAQNTKTLTTAASGTGTWDMEFDVEGKLEYDTNYVVFEEAISEVNLIDTDDDGRPDSKQEVKHKNPADKSQTILTKRPKGVIRIVKKDKESNQRIGGAVFDIYEKGLDGNPSGTAVKSNVTVPAAGKEIELPSGDYIAEETAAPAGYILPNNVGERRSAFTVKKMYTNSVPYELVIKNTKKYINPNGKIGTTVSVNGERATSDAALVFKPENIKDVAVVSDIIKYEGLVGGKQYTVTGSLNKVEGGVVVDTIATSVAIKVAENSGAGEWTIDFNVAGKLDYDTNYLVFEEAVSVDKLMDLDNDNVPESNQKVEHKKADAKSQTFIPKKPKGFVKIVKKDRVTNMVIGGAVFDIYEKGTGGNILGTLVKSDVTVSAAGEKIELSIGDYIAVEKTAPAGYILPTDEADRRSPFTVKKINTSSAPYELIIKNTKKYINPNGKIGTTVSVDGERATSDAALVFKPENIKDVAVVTDIIKYEGLVQGKQYKVTGSLNKVIGGAVVETIATASAVMTAITSSGEWTMTFNVVGKLDYDTNYVVFEEAISLDNLIDITGDGTPDSKQKVEHKKADAKSQTFIPKKPKGFVKIVKKDRATGEIIGGAVFDIYEKGLDGNPSGTAIESDVTVPAAGKQIELSTGDYIAVEKTAPAGYILPANEADRRSPFTVKKINTSSAPYELIVLNTKKHDNPNGNIGTTVSVSGSAASASNALILEEDDIKRVKKVKDTISYSGLISGKDYTVKGSLNKIVNGTVAAVIAEKMQTLKAAASGTGTWDMEFDVEGRLEYDTNYVVFEEAISLDNLIDTTGDGTPDSKQKVEHKDPDAKSQTFIPKKPKGFVKIIKVDKDTNIAIGGAVFDIRKKGVGVITSGALVMTITVQVEGNKIELPVGEYIAIEKTAPAGYILSPNEADRISEFRIEKIHTETSPIEIRVRNTKEPVTPPPYVNPNGKIGTTVSVNGESATSEAALTFKSDRIEDVAVVTDTIKYEGLVGDKDYTVTGSLNRIENGVVVETVATNTVTRTAVAAGTGEWTMDFDVAGKLVYNAKYVVFEEAVSEDNLIDSNGDGIPDKKQSVVHKDSNAKSQTFIPRKPEGFVKIIKLDRDTNSAIGGAVFSIYIKGIDGNPSGPAVRAGISVPTEGAVVKLNVGNYIAEETAAPTGYIFPSDVSERRREFTVEKTHTETSPIELIVPNTKHPVPPPYVNPNGKIGTTVSVSGETATSEAALTFKSEKIEDVAVVTDIIKYEGLVQGKQYKVTGSLNKVVGTTVVEVIATTSAVKTAVTSSGEWTIDFNVAGKLVYDAKYVVYEEAVSLDDLIDTTGDGIPDSKQKVEHKDPDSKSQTFIPKKQEGFVKIIKVDKDTNLTIGGAVFDIREKGAGVITSGALVATITVPVEGHKLELPVGEYIAIEKAAPAGYILSPNEADRISEFRIEKIHTETSPIEIRVLNTKEPTTPPPPGPGYTNPNGKLGTTVSVEGKTGTTGSALIVEDGNIAGIKKVTDTIEYSGLVGDREYTIRGSLNKIENGTVAAIVAVNTVTMTAVTSGTGIWTMDFDVEGKLEYDAKYVVFEEAVSTDDLIDTNNDNFPDEKQRVEHKDPNAVTQTILTKKPNILANNGKIETIAGVGGKASTTSSALVVEDGNIAKIKKVTDTIQYSGLAGNKEYTVKGSLNKIENGTVTAIVAVNTVTMTAVTSGTGVWKMDFDVEGKLEYDTKYVVFEEAISAENLVDTNNDNVFDEKQKVEHKDPNAITQTILTKKPYTPPAPNIPPVPYEPPTPPTPPNPPPTPELPPNIPSFPPNITPDPNDPDSPDEFVRVDKDGTPRGRYVKRKKANGKNEYVKVEKDKTPKGGNYLPKTGESSDTVYYAGGVMFILLAIGIIVRRKEYEI